MKSIPQFAHTTNVDNSEYPCVVLHFHTAWSWSCIYSVLVSTLSYINTGPDVSSSIS